jgi:hypothetical protein
VHSVVFCPRFFPAATRWQMASPTNSSTTGASTSFYTSMPMTPMTKARAHTLNFYVFLQWFMNFIIWKISEWRCLSWLLVDSKIGKEENTNIVG